jgi:CBS domain-containing protein
MSITSIMKAPPVTVRADESVAVAAARMAEHDVGALLVCDEEGVAGIVTERDLMRKVTATGRDPATTPAGAIATRDPITVAMNASIRDCFELLKQHHFRHLPVVGPDGQPAGVVSSRDFLRRMVAAIDERLDVDVLCAEISTLRIDIYGD